jgi:hypothetical protein
MAFSSLEEEAAILTDHAIHRPHPGHLIEPPRVF